MKKQCNACLQHKDLSEFFKDKVSTDGHYSICKKCKTKKTLAWRSENKEEYNAKMRAYQAANKDKRRDCDYKRKYGCSLEKFNEIFQSQQMKCWICQKSNTSTKRKFALDHNHKTGKYRGILCYGCNRALHTLEKDGLLQRAYAYLETFK